MNRTHCILAALALLAITAKAEATTSGWVSGRITFYQNQGNYCPNTRTCTGANYLQSQWHTPQPAAETKVYVVDNSDRPIGSGVTDTNGNFLIRWTSSNNISSGHFFWSFEHKDGRFAVRAGAGEQWVAWTANIPLPNGTTSGSPTGFGTRQWGNSASPHAVANVNDGAWRAWFYAFNYSGLLQANFTNVEIRAFNTSCATSCAGGKRVNLDTNATTPYAPAARIQHELGHIVSDQESQGLSSNRCNAFNWTNPPPTPVTNSGAWSMQSAEFACGAFEEAYATFTGDVARYWNNAPGNVADTCTSVTSGICNDMLEIRTNTPGGAQVACNTTAGNPESRWPISVERLLWDAYDNANEASDTFGELYWRLLLNQNNFAVGHGNNQRDEPWAVGFGSLVDGDGHSSVDYRARYQSVYGLNLSGAATNNCNPVGD